MHWAPLTTSAAGRHQGRHQGRWVTAGPLVGARQGNTNGWAVPALWDHRVISLLYLWHCGVRANSGKRLWWRDS